MRAEAVIRRVGRLVAPFRGAGVAAIALAASTAVVALLEATTSVPNASAVYIAAVVLVAVRAGTRAALGTSFGAFILYNLLFVEPRFTLTVDEAGELLNLVLLLVVSVLVGRLAASAAERADAALAREHDARALGRVSRALAMREETGTALAALADVLRRETGMRRVWIAAGAASGPERILADTGPGVRPAPAVQAHLQREADGTAGRWVRVHQAAPSHAGATGIAYRVRIELGGRVLGWVWALGGPDEPPPDAAATRLLAAAADQIGQALEQERLAAQARAAAIARESDTLKTALLESVSHDLRTPLASIRAAAGTLLDPAVRIDADERRAIAAAIDREAEHLARLVTDLLDLGRIESGSLRADRDAYELDELVTVTLDRVRPRLGDRPVDVALARSLPAVLVDPLFLEQILANLLENAARYAPAPAPIRIAATVAGGAVRLTVEDGGPGVPPDAMPRLFDKFFRVAGRDDAVRRGTGVGLAVVRGLALAMGAGVAARPSELGGLAIDIVLETAQLPAELSS